MQSLWKETAGRPLAIAAVLLAAAMAPRAAQAQIVVTCDFDIADDRGQFTWGSTVHLRGRAGAGSNRGTFVVVNGNSAESDVDKDGYGPTCTFDSLFVSQRTNLIHVDDPVLAVPGANIVVVNFPRHLDPGESGEATIFVEIPPGTVAGTYEGRIEVRDDNIFTVISPSGDILNIDVLVVELEVVAEHDIGFVDPESGEELDSVVVRGRPGERASEVFRIANLGNAPANDVRLTATDLRSESAVGLVIPSERITFSRASLSSLALSDTARVTVTVDIPRGILGGRYRGSIIAQGEGTAAQEIPLIVIVQSARGILFANNPVRGGINSVARIAFNGDPGTVFRIGIFDMTGRLVWTDEGQVFAGLGGTAESPTAGADFAVSYLWPLTNRLGEDVASGMYLVVVESLVTGRRQIAQDKLMIIR